VSAEVSLLPVSSDPPHRRRSFGEPLARLVFTFAALLVLLSTLMVLGFLAQRGLIGLWAIGPAELLLGADWRPELGRFGGRPLLFGTAVSAALALLLGGAPAVLAAIYSVELAPAPARRAMERLMALAAAVPSVVYGWLALVHLVPAAAQVGGALYGDGAPGGEGLAVSGVLLGLMIGPTVFLLSASAFAKVPKDLREASLALGASPLHGALYVVFPAAWRGVVGALLLGFARAAGETMAVQMVIGGARQLPLHLFTPTTTIATQLVADMQNARPGTLASDALYAMALVLLVFSALLVVFTRRLLLGGQK
jgi:phosphate transport system permease protein